MIAFILIQHSGLLTNIAHKGPNNSIYRYSPESASIFGHDRIEQSVWFFSLGRFAVDRFNSPFSSTHAPLTCLPNMKAFRNERNCVTLSFKHNVLWVELLSLCMYKYRVMIVTFFVICYSKSIIKDRLSCISANEHHISKLQRFSHNQRAILPHPTTKQDLHHRGILTLNLTLGKSK